MEIPLNDEMIKQTSSYEGDTDFLDKLYFMCDNKNNWIELTDKQVNFNCRMLLAYYDFPIMFLKFCVFEMHKQGIGNKDMELRMKKISDLYRNAVIDGDK
jgi:hypothetical protein